MSSRVVRTEIGIGVTAVVVTYAVLGADAVTTGDWQQVLGVTVALLVIVPLLRLMNRPARPPRLRAVTRNE